jgi:hypothetical protein
MLVFILFGGIRDFSLNSGIVFFCFVLIFFIPVSACLLFGNMLRKQKIKKYMVSLCRNTGRFSIVFVNGRGNFRILLFTFFRLCTCRNFFCVTLYLAFCFYNLCIIPIYSFVLCNY